MKITVKCVSCKHMTEVGANQREIPMCPKCFSPMYAVKAETS